MYCISKKYIKLKEIQKELQDRLGNLNKEIREEMNKELKFICEKCNTVNFSKETDLLDMQYYNDTIYEEGWEHSHFAFNCKNCNEKYRLDEEESDLFGYSGVFKSYTIVKK